jgi:uncharacterized protein (DUF849 family)
VNKRIVTAAITGSIHTPSMSPHLPITPPQIIDEILAVHEAGGSICHVHVRDPENGRPITDLGMYKEVASEVKKKCDVVLCITTGGGLGMTAEERARPVSALKPELASLNAGSINFALHPILDKIKEFKYSWEHEYLSMTEDVIFANTCKTLRQFSDIFRSCQTKPELEIYDAGMINNIAFLISNGQIDKPVYLQFVLGILGAITPTSSNLMFLLDYAQKRIGDFQFSVCAAGRHQMTMCTQSLLLGGNVRVGLEDSLYLEKGVLAKSNAEQVAKIIRIMRELGLEPATPSEAREILVLKGLDHVDF